MNRIEITPKWFMLILLIIISGFFEYNFDIPNMNILGMIILCFGSMWLCNFNPFHPYFWFSGILSLYSCSYPILYIMNFSYFTQWGYSADTMRYPWFALVTFLVFYTPPIEKSYDFSLLTSNIKSKGVEFNNVNRIFLHFLELLMLVISIKLAMSGYTSKKEIQAAGDVFFSVGERCAMFLAIDFAFFVVNQILEDKKITEMKMEFLFSLLPILIFVSSTGDRSTLFRYIFYIGIILFAFGILKPRHLLILIPGIIVFLTFSNVFRYIFMADTSGRSLFGDWRSFVYNFLTSDFHCAGRNLQILINHANQTKGKFGLGLIINDILFVFIRNGDMISVSEWFNDTFFSGTIYGQAFSLVGEGYVMAGYWGVLFLFIIIAILIKYLYLKSTTDIYWFVLYIVVAAGLCFAFREMFMSVLSPIFRQCVPVFIIIYILNKCYLGRGRYEE